MSETLDLVGAVGPAIDAGLLEDAIQVLVKSGWSNSTEETTDTPIARERYFGDMPADNSVVVVGRFDAEPVSAAMGRIETWNYSGSADEYIGYMGKTALALTLFGARIPYRGLGFGSQTLAAVAHTAHLNKCSLMSMVWADFQWEWFQGRGSFEGKFGRIAESVRSLPVRYPGFDPARLQILG
jgi:hypothetical protein